MATIKRYTKQDVIDTSQKTEVCYEKANEEKRVVIYCRESRDDSKNIRRNLRHKIEEGYLPK